MININNCTVDTLTAKVGIPLGVAWQIVAYKRDRKQRQTIECLDELKNIPGMTDQHFEKLLRHCKTFGYSALSSSTKSRRNATKNENKELEKGGRRKLKGKRIKNTQNISKKVVNTEQIPELNKNYNRRIRKGQEKSLVLNPVSVSASQSGNKLFVTYIPGLPEALNFLNSQKSGESLVRECPPPFASSPQPGSSPRRASSPPRPLSPQRSSSPPRPRSPQRSSSPPRPLSPERTSSSRPSQPKAASPTPRPIPPQPASSSLRPLLKRASSPLCSSPESTKISRRESRSPALKRSKTPKRLKINSPRTHRYMVSELIKKPDKNDHETQLSTRAVIPSVELGLPTKTCIDDRPEKDGEAHQIKKRSHRPHRLKKERRRHHSRMSKERRHHSRQRNKRRRKSSQSIARRKKRLLHSKQRNEKRRQSNLGNKKRPRHHHQRTVRFKNNGQDIYVDQPNESPNNSFIERDLGPEKNTNKTDKRCPDNANQGPPITGWSCIIL